jgi:hypothetical protein
MVFDTPQNIVGGASKSAPRRCDSIGRSAGQKCTLQHGAADISEPCKPFHEGWNVGCSQNAGGDPAQQCVIRPPFALADRREPRLWRGLGREQRRTLCFRFGVLIENCRQPKPLLLLSGGTLRSMLTHRGLEVTFSVS